MIDIKEKINSYLRVLSIAKKPDKEEFFHDVKICAVGVGIAGIVGYLLYIVSILFLG